MSKLRSLTLERGLPWLLVVGGAVGLVCAFIISIDKLKLLENPGAHLPCNLNPIISCGSVMQSAQAHAFGFPNPFIGLAAFGALMAIGAGLLAGATFKRWFWLGLEAGTVFGLGFIHWLFFESVYRIHSLCPYCMVVWIVTITTFWYVTLYNLQKGHLRPPASLHGACVFARKHHLDILVLWLLALAALILKHFWYYYGPRLGF